MDPQNVEVQTNPELVKGAEIVLPSPDLKKDLPFFLKRLGFRLDKIFPADDPSVAVISGHGVSIRLDRDAQTRCIACVSIAMTLKNLPMARLS